MAEMRIFSTSTRGSASTLRGGKANLAGQLLGRALQHRQHRRERGIARVAAHFGQRAQGPDGAELLEDVGIAQNGGFGGVGIVERLMRADGLAHAVKLIGGKPAGGKEFPGARNGVGNVVPALQFCLAHGPVPDIDAQVVHPCGGKEHVVVIVHAFADLVARAYRRG